jgi:hypothetical protein
MKTHLKHAVWAAAGVMIFTTACDVPVLPQWDTNWNVPLPSQAIPFPPVPIPNNTSVNDSFPTQQQPLDKSIGDLLANAADTGSVILTLSKRQTLALAGTDTLLISTSAAGLNTPGSGRIVVPIAFAATDASVTDTVSANLSIIRTASDANGTLFVRLQGRISNTSGGTVTPTTADSLHVRLALLTLIHSSK